MMASQVPVVLSGLLLGLCVPIASSCQSQSSENVDVAKVLRIPEGSNITGLSWAPGGDWLAAISGGKILFWNLRTDEEREVKIGEVCWSIAWGKTDNQLLYNTTERRGGERKSVLKRIDIQTKAVETLEVKEDRAFGKLYRTSGREVMVFGKDDHRGPPIAIHSETSPPTALRIWSVEDDEEQKTLLFARGNSAPKQIPWEDPIVAGIFPSGGMGLVAFKTVRHKVYKTVVIDLNGEVLSEFPDAFSPYDWSPNGSLLAGYRTVDGEEKIISSSIVVYDAKGGNLTNLTTGDEMDFYPVWGPAGKSIAFLRGHDSIIIASLKERGR